MRVRGREREVEERQQRDEDSMGSQGVAKKSSDASIVQCRYVHEHHYFYHIPSISVSESLFNL